RFLRRAVPDIRATHFSVVLPRSKRGSEVMESRAQFKNRGRASCVWQSLQSDDVTMHVRFEIGAFVGIVTQERPQILLNVPARFGLFGVHSLRMLREKLFGGGSFGRFRAIQGLFEKRKRFGI